MKFIRLIARESALPLAEPAFTLLDNIRPPNVTYSNIVSDCVIVLSIVGKPLVICMETNTDCLWFTHTYIILWFSITEMLIYYLCVKIKNYPEFTCYRDVVFWWKYLLNPDREAFPNYVYHDQPVDVKASSDCQHNCSLIGTRSSRATQWWRGTRRLHFLPTRPQ